jgi:hypothetical protein
MPSRENGAAHRKENHMSGFYEKDYLDLYDFRKSKKAGKVKKSLHA